MAIYQRGKSWYYDFVHKGQRYAGSFGPVSKTVAKEELARKKTEVIEGKLNPAKARKSPRFDTFTVEYLEWAKSNKKPSTVLRNRYAVSALVSFFGMKKLNEISPWHVEQYKKARKEAALAPPTINYELAVLKGLLRKAQEWGNLVNAPDLTVKKLKAEESRTRFLSEEEETHFLTVCTPALSRVVKTGLLTGFRRQELVNLRPEDIHFERGTVRVAACFAKNGESRTLPLSPRLHAVLAEAMSARGNAPVVFTTAQGNPWTVASLSSAFKRAVRKAELQNFGPHVLRHTFASRLVMAGVDLRTVQELMGHKSITMTVRYAHLSQGHKRAAMEALESRFSEKSPANFHNTPPDASFAPQEKVLAFR